MMPKHSLALTTYPLTESTLIRYNFYETKNNKTINGPEKSIFRTIFILQLFNAIIYLADGAAIGNIDDPGFSLLLEC